MLKIEDRINAFIKELSKDHPLFEYIYNVTPNNEGISKIYYSAPYWDYNEITAIFKSVLLGKWISSGESVNEFEKEFSRKFHVNYSLMVNSGSSANLVMIGAIKKVLKWENDNEIILSSVGFPTTLAPIIQNNLIPIFIDIEFDTLNFNLDLIENKINNKTKAIFVSPVLGNSPDMNRIFDLCKSHHLELILDNCDSLGSKWNNEYLSKHAITSSCSFYPSHHLSCGEGGMVSSDNKEIIDTARSMSWWGRSCFCIGSQNLLQNGTCNKRFDKWLYNYNNIIDHKYVFNNIGYNLKPLDLQGAIGLIQLNKFDEIHEKRVANKKIIQDLFEKHIPFLKFPIVLPLSEPSWFGTPIICDNINQKQLLVSHLEKNGIQTRNYFAGNILLHGAYKHLGDYKDYPNANKVLESVFFVGCAPHYNSQMFAYIEKVLKIFTL